MSYHWFSAFLFLSKHTILSGLIQNEVDWCLLSTYCVYKCGESERDLGWASRNAVSHGGEECEEPEWGDCSVMDLWFPLLCIQFVLLIEYSDCVALLWRGLPLPPPPPPACCSSRAWNHGIINIIKVLIKIEGVGHCVKCLILCIFNWLSV